MEVLRELQLAGQSFDYGTGIDTGWAEVPAVAGDGPLRIVRGEIDRGDREVTTFSPPPGAAQRARLPAGRSVFQSFAGKEPHEDKWEDLKTMEIR